MRVMSSWMSKWLLGGLLVAGLLVAGLLVAGLLVDLLLSGALPATAQESGGSVCVAAFADDNRNGIRDANEAGLLPDVIFNLHDGQGVIFASHLTDGQNEPHCFAGLPPGDFSVTFNSAAYTATGQRALNFTLTAEQLVPLTQFFGAVAVEGSTSGASSAATITAETTMMTRLLLSLLGAMLTTFLMTALGAVVYRVRFRSSRRSY